MHGGNSVYRGRYGIGNWKLIAEQYDFGGRTAVDLKDKYRNMERDWFRHVSRDLPAIANNQQVSDLPGAVSNGTKSTKKRDQLTKPPSKRRSILEDSD